MLAAIDPGHNNSGVDTGASGNGLVEQDLTLNIAKKLKSLLLAKGIDVVMTREGDTVLADYSSATGSLQARCDIANEAKADIFVSIHINSGGGTGPEIYYYQPGDKAEILAKKIYPYLVNAGEWTPVRGIKSAHDYVLANTDMPAVLTQSGFIDNKADADKLKDEIILMKIAAAHAKGIYDYCDYFGLPYGEIVPSILIFGNKGHDVVKLQNILNSKGFDCGVADGVFGDITKKAVVSFQRKRNIAPDGVAGPLTWKELLK
jgi:N-acetylmuramoyl-L-alanine amidase